MTRRAPLLVLLASLALVACRNSDSEDHLGPAGVGGTGNGTAGKGGATGAAGAAGGTTGIAGAAGGATGTAGAAGGTTGIAGAAGSATGIAGAAAGATGTAGAAAGATGTAGAAGGSTGTAGAAGGNAGRGGAGGNSTCATATENGACSSEGASCGSCTDICQFCNLLRCTGGHWQRFEAAPAPCFTCGTDIKCQSYVQYCEVTTGGPIDAGTSYHCRQFPASCPSTASSCSCLNVTSPNTCSESGGGAVQVTVNAS